MSSQDDDPATMSIGEVARRTGVTVPTLRAWERRYELLVPIRTAGGHRRYREEDMRRVLAVLELVRQGWAVLEQPTTRQIARAVAGRPGIHQAAICEVAGVRPPSASKHLARLERSGLVATQRVSRYTVYEATEELQRILALHGDGDIDERAMG